MDCLFCKIVNKELPSKVLYEDDKFVCFMDINPHTKGHCLVIPKEHAENFTALDNDTVGEFAKLVHRIAPQVAGMMKADAYNVGMNNGAAAGQVIGQVHWHIIPRYRNDGLEYWGINEEEVSKLDERFTELDGKIK